MGTHAEASAGGSWRRRLFEQTSCVLDEFDREHRVTALAALAHEARNAPFSVLITAAMLFVGLGFSSSYEVCVGGFDRRRGVPLPGRPRHPGAMASAAPPWRNGLLLTSRCLGATLPAGAVLELADVHVPDEKELTGDRRLPARALPLPVFLDPVPGGGGGLDGAVGPRAPAAVAAVGQ